MRFLRRLGLVAVLLCGGCSETVAFVTVDLLVPDPSPPIVCKNDPRRVSELRLSATCDGESMEHTAKITGNSFSVSDVPLGDCTLDIQAVNTHGRVVLSGSVTGTIKEGENDPVKLQLVEEPCDAASCDTDGDNLADHDEKAIGTDVTRVDSDSDGLEDGLELLQCCTDPTLPGGQCRELLIQRVEPNFGTIGAAVIVKASAPLDQPQVEVGGVALSNLLADSTIALGTVAQGASLGEVSLTTGGGKVDYQYLFAVLHAAPETLAEISNKASGVGPVIYQLVDQAFDGPRQFLLGRSLIKGSAGAANTVVTPILLMIDHAKAGAVKAIVAAKGEPVAVSAAGGRVMVLLDVGGTAEMVLFSPSKLAPILGLPKKLAFQDTTLSLQKPVTLGLESGDTAQLLLQNRLVRLKFDTNGQVGATGVTSLTKLAGGATSCVGMALGGDKTAPTTSGAPTGSTYVTCNTNVPCPVGTKCKGQHGQLITVPPSCLPLSSNVKPDPNKVCGMPHLIQDPIPVLGNPTLDRKRKVLYLLSGGGVVSAPLEKTPPMLTTLVPFKWSGTSKGRDLMAVAGSHLFVVDGPRVWRMDPGQADPVKRRGKPFVVSRGADEAELIAASADGASLGVSVRHSGGFSWVMNVCLSPCKGP